MNKNLIDILVDGLFFFMCTMSGSLVGLWLGNSVERSRLKRKDRP